jgi:hypothetical protein
VDSLRGGLYTESPPPSRRHVRSPGNRSQGVSQGEAERAWKVHQRVLLELEHAGKLLAIRIGNRVWYSYAQLVAQLGEPSTSVIGRQLRWSEFDDAAKTA